MRALLGVPLSRPREPGNTRAPNRRQAIAHCESYALQQVPNGPATLQQRNHVRLAPVLPAHYLERGTGCIPSPRAVHRCRNLRLIAEGHLGLSHRRLRAKRASRHTLAPL